MAKAEKPLSTRLDLQAGHWIAPDSISARDINSSKLCPHFLQVNSYIGMNGAPYFSCISADVSEKFSVFSLCSVSVARSPIEQDCGPQPGLSPIMGNTKFTRMK